MARSGDVVPVHRHVQRAGCGVSLQPRGLCRYADFRLGRRFRRGIGRGLRGGLDLKPRCDRRPAACAAARLYPHQPFAIVVDGDVGVGGLHLHTRVQLVARGGHSPANQVMARSGDVVPVHRHVQRAGCGVSLQPRGLCRYADFRGRRGFGRRLGCGFGSRVRCGLRRGFGRRFRSRFRRWLRCRLGSRFRRWFGSRLGRGFRCRFGCRFGPRNGDRGRGRSSGGVGYRDPKRLRFGPAGEIREGGARPKRVPASGQVQLPNVRRAGAGGSVRNVRAQSRRLSDQRTGGAGRDGDLQRGSRLLRGSRWR